MVISASDELVVVVPLNVDDFEVSKVGVPAQVEQLEVGIHKSEDPVSRTTSNGWGGVPIVKLAM
jgi:hypothetical protein